MIFDTGVLLSIAGRGIYLPMGITNTTTNSNGNSSITIYTGAQPNANVLISDWASYNTSYLLHRSNVIMYLNNMDTKENTKFISMRTFPLSQTAINTGNAEWGIIWIGNQSEANVRGNSIPNTFFIICPVGDVFSNSVIKLDSANISTSNTYNIADATIRISFQ